MNLIPCPHCPMSNKRFKGKHGLGTHIGRKHPELRFSQVSSVEINKSMSNETEDVRTDFERQLCNLKKKVKILRRLPKAARGSAAIKLASILDDCRIQNSYKSWRDVFTYSYLYLCIPECGNTKSLSTVVKKNINMGGGSYDKRKRKPLSFSSRIDAKVAEGDIRGAVKLLSTLDTLAEESEETVENLRLKHPSPTVSLDFPSPPSDEICLVVDEKEVYEAIMTFPNGSSGGMDGLRPQHLKDLISESNGNAGSICLTSLTKFCNFVLSCEIDKNFSPLFFGASLCALNKSGGGIRPIAVGCVLRRLIAKLACNSIREEMGQYFRPKQFGFGTKKGCEEIVHATRSFLDQEESVDKCVLKIDYSNAFNSVNRDFMLRAVKQKSPGIFNFVWQAYFTPSKLFFCGNEILSISGCQQGDPLGPFLFCLCIHAIVTSLKSELVAFYLDDGIIGGMPDQVLHDFKVIVSESAKIGLTVNFSKCELYCSKSGIDEKQNKILTSFPEIKLMNELCLLGAPITINCCKNFLIEKMNSLSMLFERLKLLNSMHVAYFLLKNCLAIPKLTYLLRVTPTWLFEDFIMGCDNIIKEALEFVLNISLIEDQTYRLATLPVRYGGVGVRMIKDICLPAFASSIFGTLELINYLLPRMDKPNVSFQDEVLDAWKQINPEERPCSVQLGFQKSWDIINLKRIINNMNFPTVHSKARFLALQKTESNVWLNSLPSSSLGTLMDNNTFRIALGIRLGCKICQKHVCICGDMVDEYGLHGLHCSKSAGRFSRHQEINQILHRALSSCQVPNSLEPPGLLRNDGKRVDGVSLIPWKRGRCIAWDATCGDTYAPSYVSNSSSAAGFVAAKLENLKRSKYSSLIQQNIDFLPFAVETAGTFGEDALNFVGEIGQRLKNATGEVKSKYYLLQRLGLAIQRGNAASLMGTFPSNDKFFELFYLLDDSKKSRVSPFEKRKSSRRSELPKKNVSVINNTNLAPCSSRKVGLNNLGNTCYFNSILQALFMTKKFRNEVLLLDKSGMSVFSKLQDLFVLLQYSQKVSVSPIEILQVATPPGFQQGQQHDCSELLEYLLDLLHVQEQLAKNSESRMETSNCTIVHDSFEGCAKIVLRCNICSTSSERIENFRVLQLSFPSDLEDLSITKLIYYYLQPERLCGDNQYHCEACSTLTDGEKVTHITEIPSRLILTVKHFCYDVKLQQKSKLLHRVKLDNIIALNNISYELYAAVVHFGSRADSGHFYTLARDGDDWFKFNDCSVVKTTLEFLTKLKPPETPYILYYRRQDSDEPDTIPCNILPSRLQKILEGDRNELELYGRVRGSRTQSDFRSPQIEDPSPTVCGGTELFINLG